MQLATLCKQILFLTASSDYSPYRTEYTLSTFIFLRDKLPREKDKLRDKIPARENEKPFNGDFDPKNRQEARATSPRGGRTEQKDFRTVSGTILF
ncbi:hypothetical protein CEXT_511141 [Caerostris extrusa]|uniref:Uncharacterized protein n=1 Tax=Caerostris extrusa TaxID=172846 RepID=A0AAV4VWG3_CAEEX|nr:hypothetical protein CEXT_511141 [Caerostris extrusa]